MRLTTAVMIISFVAARALDSGSGASSPSTTVAEPATDGDQTVETFVLTPIRSDVSSMLVPADIRGPVTNNSCRDWANRTESCYLPARTSRTGSADRPELAGLLERHLCGVIGAWKPGSWPADGASINVPLEQYASLEQVWLTYRIDMRQAVGACWIGGQHDPVEPLNRAASQPAATLELEMFGGTHSAQGYPKKVQF